MTDAELHARASALFLELRAQPEDARRSALGSAASRDPRLAAEVASLLEHDPGGGSGVTSGPPAVGDRLSFGDTLAVPGRIGPYRIVARIGRGGSGHVFLGEQDAPVRRRVAIKVVPQAAVDPELAARFDVERRALESTNHPNITRILDAGRTPDGLPYLVMNLVEGQTITDYCAHHELPLADRVRLMLDVADAVQHAHQRGVIHRDLKPANLLVTEIDNRPVPQVLDFGIAKPVAGALRDESPPTRGLPMGTPAYMAPEQTRPSAIDTRADVYALGAVLYELTAGAPPLDTAGDPLAAIRRIRETVPPPASRVRAGRLSSASGPQRAAPGPVPRRFLADLDVILGKALEKQPDRRYASVGALIDDLRRLLACEPIAAAAPSLRYRAARFAQRNRLLVGAAAVAIAAVGVGVAGLATGLVEAREQRAEALRQGEAQREVNAFLTDDLLAQASPDRGGKDLTVLEMLDRASAVIDRRFAERPLIAASIHHALGEAYGELGVFDAAERHLSAAVDLRHAAAGADSPDAVHSELSVASLLARRERLPEAQAALVTAITRARLILGLDDPELYAGLNNLGVVLAGLDRPDEALDVLSEALAGRRRLHAPDRQILETLNNLAQARDQKGDAAGSLVLLREALAVAEASPDGSRMTLLGLQNNIGATLQDLGRNDEAEPYLRRAAALAEDVLGRDHPGTLTIESNLAGLQADLGEPEQAIATFERVIDGQTALYGPAATDTLIARHGYWTAVSKAGRAAEAATGFAALLDDVSAALGPDHSLQAQTGVSLARALLDSGRAAEALPHAVRAADRLTALYGSDHVRASSARRLVESIRAQLPGTEANETPRSDQGRR